MIHASTPFLWFMAFLVFSSLLHDSQAFLTKTTSDGHIIRIPGHKPLSPIEDFSFVAARSNITPRERRPQGKPKPPGGASSDDKAPKGRLDGSMCGLDTPSEEKWDANREDIAKWFLVQYNAYVQEPSYENIALFLRDRWAPHTVSSGLFCDDVGSCSIGTCKNLVEDNGTNHHDRQMALYVFEQIANAAHLYQAVIRQVTDAINDILHRSNQVVEEFSSAPRIEKALKDELKKQKIGMAVAQALGLVISGGFGFVGGNPSGSSAAMTRASVNMVVNSYIAMTTVINEFRENPEFVHDLKESFHDDLAAVLNKAKKSVSMDLHDLMIGAADSQKRTIVDLFTDSGFLEPHPNFMPKLGEHVGRVVMGAAIDKMWEFDRAYFVLVDNPGGCESEKTTYVRGPHAYLICLPERPKIGFWFYSIDRFHENDTFHDEQAMVRGPTGWWRLNGDSRYFGITLQDVARSSYWVHQKKLFEKKGDLITFDPQRIDTSIRVPNEKERMNGVFTVPICRNPGGESISGVLHEKGQNYPCMCGEFSWQGGWTREKDETPRFLALTRFMFSEDWEDWCSGKNKCKGAKEVDLKQQLERLRGPKDPEIPHHLKHPFYKCKKHRDSKKHPGWPDKDMYNNVKRNPLDWAVQDERGRNSSRAVASFEG